MASPPPSAPLPVGEDNWVDYIDQQRRHADSLEKRIRIVELYRSAVNAEPGSIKVWLASCEYFWSLHRDCQLHNAPGWTPEEQAAARDLFSLDAALHLWSDGHDATKYRLNDSHELWNRWISLEKELLDRTRTPDGIKRITHLYRNRLQTPHTTWDETSQMFSTFLSEYNPSGYESTMKDITDQSKEAKKLYGQRDHLEVKLKKAVNSANVDDQKAAMLEYLSWEIINTKKDRKNQRAAVELALALFSRALTGLFVSDESVWIDFIVYVSHCRHVFTTYHKNTSLIQLVPNTLDVLQRAVLHCPWSGAIWARYVLSGEEAGLSFADMERIKHAATNCAQLDKDGMTAVVDMYSAWCGYLKRTAMDPNANDEHVDIADSGLVAALEAVQVWGERRFGDTYQGDPSFRLERILIQYLTEKHAAIDEARDQWKRLSENNLYANSYDFWLQYFMWEMLVFQAQKGNGRSPTPSASGQGLRVPTMATQVLETALHNRKLDWPERVMEIYLSHCNDYQTTETLRRALDTMHKVKKGITKRRQQEAAEAAAAYAAQAELQAQQPPAQSVPGAQGATQESPSGEKRKRDTAPNDALEHASKRAKSEHGGLVNGEVSSPLPSHESEAQKLKRDRENTSVIVTNLPADITATKVRAYFKEYGHMVHLQLKKETDGKSSLAMIEFKSTEDVQSALIRDGKYFGEDVISVKPASDLTLFVTNFPPTADETYIRDLFKDCGEVFAVRWPSLKFNTRRRFCYVSFREPEASSKATKLDGKMLEGRYKLQAKYSDPSQKKGRDDAATTGREVHIKNLDHHVDEDALEEIFAKYGKVSRVRILRNIGGESRGSAFVVYDTRDEAEHAVAELNNTKLRTQILTVEMSTPSNYNPSARMVAGTSMSPDPGGRDNEGDDKMTDREAAQTSEGQASARTFALLGLSDTVNITRVQSLAEQHGQLVKVVLRADHGGAIIEFSDAATAGKAQLALEGTELDGRKLRTGTVQELFREKVEKKADRLDRDNSNTGGSKPAATRLQPPPRIHRPTLGKGGNKRGLGYVGFKPPITSAHGQDNGETKINGRLETEPAPKKSNADFRSMFLSKDAKDEKEKSTENGQS